MLKCTLIGHVGLQPLTLDLRSNPTPEGFEPLTKRSKSNSPTNCTLWQLILYARRMVRRGQSYAVDSKRSIDLKTQFVAHVLIRYSILPRPSFINK